MDFGEMTLFYVKYKNFVYFRIFQIHNIFLKSLGAAFGKPVPGATFHYKFPENAHNAHNMKSTIFIEILSHLLCLSDLDLVEIIS